MNPTKPHVRAKTSIHSKRHSKARTTSPKIAKFSYGEIKNFHTIDLDSNSQDYNPALEEKTQRELKAVEDLCALSEEETTFLSFDHDFDKIWPTSEKSKKNNTTGFHQGGGVAKALSSRGYGAEPSPPPRTENNLYQKYETGQESTIPGAKWTYMKKGDGAKKGKGERAAVPRMELGKVRILRDFIRENALSSSRRGYTKEQETLIKDQIERLLSERNSERTPIPHNPQEKPPSFSTKPVQAQTTQREAKEVKEGKEVLDVKIKNFVIENDHENNIHVLNSVEIPIQEVAGANFRESFFKLFKGKQFMEGNVDLEMSISQRRIGSSNPKIKRTDSKKTDPRISRVPTSQAVSRIVSRHDSLEAPVESEKPANSIFKEIGYDRLNKSTGFSTIIRGEKKHKVALETRRETQGVIIEDQAANELQAKTVQQSIQRIQIRSKWSSYLGKLKVEEASGDVLTSQEVTEEKREKYRPPYKIKFDTTMAATKEVPESPNETTTTVNNLTAVWTPRKKEEGGENILSNVMANLREVKNLKRLNLTSLGKKEAYSPFKTMNAWPKDILQRGKGSNLRDASPFGHISNHVRPATRERPLSALNIKSPSNRPETVGGVSYSRELRGLGSQRKEEDDDKINNNLLKKLMSDSSQKRFNHKRSNDKLMKSEAYSKLLDRTDRTDRTAIGSRKDRDYANLRIQHRYIKNALQRNSIGSGQVKEVVATPVAVQISARVATSSRLNRSKEMPFLEAIGRKVN